MHDGLLHTTFAWLGHGTLANRTSVKEFLRLLDQLGLKDEEMKMSDNYFTILSNEDKRGDIWLDHGIELGGGQPFTVGQAGDERNDKHIVGSISNTMFLVSLTSLRRRPWNTCRLSSKGKGSATTAMTTSV